MTGAEAVAECLLAGLTFDHDRRTEYYDIDLEMDGQLLGYIEIVGLDGQPRFGLHLNPEFDLRSPVSMDVARCALQHLRDQVDL